MSTKEKAEGVGIGCVAILVVVVFLCQIGLYREVHTGVYRCIKTYTITTGSGDTVSTSKRVDLKPVSGGSVETMRCDDALTLGQLNSATIYGQLEVGKWYKITARGPRNPLLSMFPNLTEVVEVEHKE